MIKNLFLLIAIFALTGCDTKTDNIDYYGQIPPDTIPIIFGENVISVKGRLEHGISFSPDGQEFAFGILNKDDFNGEIYYSTKSNNNWTEPTIFEPLKNQCVYLPYFSPSGNSLLYAQSKPDADNGYTDIWIIEKTNGIWSSPEKLQAPLNSNSREANACMTNDGTIYFSSNRNCIGIDDCHTADLFYSKRVNNEYHSVEAISEFISSNDEESVFISPKEEFIIFCRYSDNETWMDLYISYRDCNNNWLEPQILDSTINSKNWDRRPFVSIDNKYLFFTRLTFVEQGLAESDIYWVSTKKAFKPFVYNPIADISVSIGENINIVIPKDYFRDIDDENLSFTVNLEGIEWLEFEKDNMILTGKSSQVGEFDIIFTSTDKYSNKTEDTIKLTVEN